MATNTSSQSLAFDCLSQFLYLIGQPARIQILLVIGAQPACVCHLEAALGMRQAAISQHLMALRRAGLVETERDGRNIFYRLTQPAVLDLLRQAAQLSGLDADSLKALTVRPVPDCDCPQCHPEMDIQDTCRKHC